MNTARIDEVMVDAVTLWELTHPGRLLSIDPYDRYRTVLMESPAPVVDDIIDAFVEDGECGELLDISVEEMRAVMLLTYEEAARMRKMGKRFDDKSPADKLAFSYGVVDKLRDQLSISVVRGIQRVATARYKREVKMDKPTIRWGFIDRLVDKLC